VTANNSEENALPSMVARLAEVLKGAGHTDCYLDTREAARFMGVSERFLRDHTVHFIRLGAKVIELPSQSTDPKRRRLRWLKSSLLGMARGLGDAVPSARVQPVSIAPSLKKAGRALPG